MPSRPLNARWLSRTGPTSLGSRRTTVRLRVQLLDLYAHLRGVFPAPEAHWAARYVLELGWRPWVRSEPNPDAALPVSAVTPK